MVSKLKWELSAVTPGDFLLHILSRLPVDSRAWDFLMIKRHAQTFIALSARGENINLYICIEYKVEIGFVVVDGYP